MPVITGLGDVAPGLTMPTQHIMLQLADPWTPVSDYTEITPFVKEWNGMVRGRQHELQLFQPGTVAITLNNSIGGGDGRFSPWNTQGPYFNLLTPGDASCETADGTVNTAPLVSNWLTGSTETNCTVVQAVPPVLIDGPVAYKLTASSTSASVTMPINYYAVTAGNRYSIMGSFLAGSTGRVIQINAVWYTSGGALISTSSVSVTDNASTWTKASNLGVLAPATAAFVALQVKMATTANTEVHYFSRIALFNYLQAVPNTAWAPGQRLLPPGRPIYCTAKWAGVTYDIWSMYVSNWTPQYGQVKSEQVINASDGLALLALGDVSSSAYANQVLADGATSLWRLGDNIGSLTALDSGPNNYTINAPQLVFGATSPLLTDDTTVAAFTGGSSQGSLYLTPAQSPAVGAQTLEMMILMPVTTTNQMIAWTAAGSSFWFNPTNSTLELSANGGGGTGTNTSVVAPTLNNGSWHHLVLTCSAATSGTLKVYLDGALILSHTAAGGASSCFFDTSSYCTFGVSGISGANGFLGDLGNIAIYAGTALTGGASGQVVNHYALFSAGWAIQYSGQRIQEILTVVGWPSNLQNIATGIEQVQGATSSLTQTSSLSYLQTIEGTEMGALFVDPVGNLTFYDRHYVITATAAIVSNGTFSDNPNTTGSTVYRYLPGLIPAMDDVDLWNDVPVQRNGGVLQRVTSALSIKQYTRRTLTGYTGSLQTSDAAVLAQAQWLIAHYATPITRCRSITLSSRTDAGRNLPQMLGRGIFDNVELEWKPIDASNVYFLQNSLVESINHKVTMSEWVTTFGLSPAETSPYMVLNNATRGQLSTVNQLGY